MNNINSFGLQPLSFTEPTKTTRKSTRSKELVYTYTSTSFRSTSSESFRVLQSRAERKETNLKDYRFNEPHAKCKGGQTIALRFLQATH